MEETILQKNKDQIALYLSRAILFIWGFVFLVFPIFLLPFMTDAFVLAKQALIAGAALLTLLLWGARIVVLQKFVIRKTFLDLPLILLVLAFILSALFAVERLDSLINTAPILFAVIGFFVIVNSIKKENNAVFLLGSIVLSTVLLAVWALFSYFKVYPLSIPATHTPSFSPVGTLLEQMLIFAIILPIPLQSVFALLKSKTDPKTISFSVASVIILGGSLVTLIQLFTTQKPTILPLETGFQTAFAAISQDAGRIAQGFLFGSGYGSFASVFTRFKQASFNTNYTFWASVFGTSSSFMLEILATTGILGLLTTLFLMFRVIEKPAKKLANPVFLSLAVAIVLSFLFPFSSLEIMLIILLLSLYVLVDASKHPSHYFDVELRFVTLKKGLLSFSHAPTTTTYENSRIMGWVVAGIFALIVGTLGYFAGKFVISDIYFQRSIVEAAKQNGTATYQNQVTAISTFPYRSAYYRIFSQTNMALANSLTAAFPKTGKPSDQQQQTLYQLIQQSINTGRTATAMSPLTAANWQNLSSIYRALIGLGQDADKFAVAAAQQAEQVDPTNPQEYIALGGIYYQLKQYDDAIRQFQIAVSLKPDYSNGYYNLGHAYEQKGDLQNALTALKTVASLEAGNKQNSEKVAAEIKDLEAKVGNSEQATQTTTTGKTGTSGELGLPSQPSSLPAQTTPIPLQATPTPTR